MALHALRQEAESNMIRALDGTIVEEKSKKFNRDVHFSSSTEEWETPQHIFDALDEEFQFTLDPCAAHGNAKTEKYFTQKDNGLHQSWKGETVFMNPPYGRAIGRWIKKAWKSGQQPDTTVVCLLPARTDTRWFHDHCVQGTIWFIKGRLKFGGQSSPAPFPSMIVIFPRVKKGNST